MGSSRTDRLTLRPASPSDGIDVWMMIQEIGPGENGFHNDGHGVPFSRFRDFLERLIEASAGRGLCDGRVPQTTYWAFADSLPVGICKVRHRLNDSLRKTGGHVGYSIRPSARRRGYATRMLGLAVREAASLGIKRLLITVYEENVPSWTVVERNGGTLVGRADGTRYYEVETEVGSSDAPAVARIPE